MTGVKLELLKRINELFEYALKGDVYLPNEICNFIVNEFDLNAAVLFEINPKNNLTVIGRTSRSRKNLSGGASFNCSNCALFTSNDHHKLCFDTSCELNISEFPNTEGCALLKLNDSGRMLIKVSKKSALTQSEIDSIENGLNLIEPVLFSWNLNLVSIESSVSFSKIVTETSNELKSSSNSIIGFTTMLANENLSANQSEYVAAIKKNTQNIIMNINDLSELAKIGTANFSLNGKNVELSGIVVEIVELFKSRLGSKKISFVVDIEKALMRPMNIDEQKLRYILSTLLFVSSTLSTQGETYIKISSIDDGKIKFSITDTSKILNKEVINNLFDPFVILKVEEFKQSPLTGLSLTLVKKYVQFLGGDITASSQENGNSYVFTISGEIMSELENKILQLPKPVSKNKVLVIEDDYATSKLLSNYLNKWGYEPVIVNTEEQAFDLINKEQLLAIILDIELPNANGLELLKKIHEHHNTKNTPVIVCSVEPEQQKAFMMGAVEYFIKPINYNFLVEVLTSYKLRKNSNILCVDDDLPTLNLIKQAIESAGFIAVAENVSANVMELIKNKDIDLAIIDLDMPTPNGFELIKLIKSEKKFSKLPIIIYTGKENYKEDLSKIEGLFEELLDKRSTNIEDLADTINAMINRYETPPPVEEVMHRDNVIKILLAEDYKHSQIIVTRLLKKNNFENVVVVENGEDAYKMSQKEKFDLILMDMQMPIMNGFEATEKIREMPEYKETPIIALTAFAMKGDREKCLEAGATDYIPKPIDSKEFIDKIKYYTNVANP